MVQAISDSWFTVTLHFIVDPEYDLTKGTHVSGEFFVDSEVLGSDAYTSISIQVDGKELWHTTDNISGRTLNPVPYSIDIDEGALEMTMVFECNALGKGLGLGMTMEAVDD